MKNYFAITSMGVALLLVSCGKKETVNTTTTDTSMANGAYILASSDLLPPPGKSYTVSNIMEMKDSKLSVSMGAKQMIGTMSNNTESVRTFEPISVGKMRHVAVSEIDKGTIIMEGQEQPTPQKSNSLIGIPVTLEVKDGKVTASLEEGDPTAEQQKELDKLLKKYESNEDFVMYGDQPRKPGDKWDVDPSGLSNFAGGTGLTGTFTVEFKSVEEINGVKCAKLECVFDLTGKIVNDGDEMDGTLSIKGKADVVRSIDDLVDMDVKVVGAMSMEGSPAEGMKMKVDGTVKMLQSTELK